MPSGGLLEAVRAAAAGDERLARAARCSRSRDTSAAGRRALLYHALFLRSLFSESPLLARPQQRCVLCSCGREGAQLSVRFAVTGNPQPQAIANLLERVVVLKFRRSQLLLPSGSRVLAFNDPYLEGISFEALNNGDLWAKLRLRRDDLRYRLLPWQPGETGETNVILTLHPGPAGIQLEAVDLEAHQGGSRVVLSLNRPTRFEAARRGTLYVLRLFATQPLLNTPLTAADDRLTVLPLDVDRGDTVFRLRLLREPLHVRVREQPRPPRIVLEVGDGPSSAEAPGAATGSAAAGGSSSSAAETTGDASAAAQHRSAEARAAAEDQLALAGALITAPNATQRLAFQSAQRALDLGEYAVARRGFATLYEQNPGLYNAFGIYTVLRLADSLYGEAEARGSRRLTEIIDLYQQVLLRAERSGYESPALARALFQIGRAYQRMGFDHEADVHYRLLQARFPQNRPYTRDSHFYLGQVQYERRRYAEAAETFERFLERGGSRVQRAATYYALGDSYYRLEQYGKARQAFNDGRRSDAAYPNDQPQLLFHLGETFYETADFELARVYYRRLLKRFPQEVSARLVALRLGDFLRDEGKSDEALAVYAQAITRGSPPRIRERGLLRMAAIWSQAPETSNLERALRAYGEVSQSDEPLLAEEALLGQALALTLHNRHSEAIIAFETLAMRFPQSPFVTNAILLNNILENIKARVDALYAANRYWDAVRFVAPYEGSYLQNFPYLFTQFQVADAYHQLGLYAKAIDGYRRLLREGSSALNELVQLRLAQALLAEDNLGEAESTLQRFIERSPRSLYRIDARLVLARLYQEQRRYDEALRVYQGLVDAASDPVTGDALAEAYQAKGKIELTLGDDDDAQRSFRESIAHFRYPLEGEQTPEFVRLAHFDLGQALFELERDEEATAAYEAALAHYPEHPRAPWARYRMGLIQRRNGHLRQALRTFEALSELAQEQPGEALWEPLVRENRRELRNLLEYREYLDQ